MKKKTIVIIIVFVVALLSFIFALLFNRNNESELLRCIKEEVDGSKSAIISYEYFIDENNILKINSVTELKFLSKEEADKYEKIVSIAFFKDEIIRENNKIIIKSDKEDTKNTLTLEEIKKQQEEKGLECIYE